MRANQAQRTTKNHSRSRFVILFTVFVRTMAEFTPVRKPKPPKAQPAAPSGSDTMTTTTSSSSSNSPPLITPPAVEATPPSQTVESSSAVASKRASAAPLAAPLAAPPKKGAGAELQPESESRARKAKLVDRESVPEFTPRTAPAKTAHSAVQKIHADVLYDVLELALPLIVDVADHRVLRSLVDRLLQVRARKHLKSNFNRLKDFLRRQWERGNLELDSLVHADPAAVDLRNRKRALIQTMVAFVAKLAETRAFVRTMGKRNKIHVFFQRVSACCHAASAALEGLEEFNALENMSMDLSALAAELRKILARLEANSGRFMVALLGLENAGKTSVLNCLAGENFFPSMLKRATMVMCAMLPERKPGVCEAEIRFLPLDDVKSLLDKNNAPDDVRQRALKMRQDAPQNGLRTITGTKQEVKAEIDPFVAVDACLPFVVESVCLYAGSPSEVPYIFKDLPGDDTPNELQRAQNRAVCANADAAIFVAHIHNPQPTDASIRLIKDMVAMHGDKFLAKSFVLVTKLDMLDNAAASQSAFNDCVDSYAKLGFKREHIFACCPPATLIQKAPGAMLSPEDKASYTRVSQSMKTNHAWMAGGWDQFSAKLDEFISRGLASGRFHDYDTAVFSPLEKLIQSVLPSSVVEVPGVLPAPAFAPPTSSSTTSPKVPDDEEENDDEIDTSRKDSFEFELKSKECFRNAREEGNIWIHTNINNEADSTFQALCQKFSQCILRFQATAKNLVVGLQRQLLAADNFLGWSSPREVELRLRRKIMKRLLGHIENSCDGVGHDMQVILADYLNHVASFLPQSVANRLCLDDIISLKEIQAEVRGIVMSAAYPIAVATVRYCHDDVKMLNAALTELRSISPGVAMKLVERAPQYQAVAGAEPDDAPKSDDDTPAPESDD
eukprot:TRINITY_DN893_c0_g2_i1.p1 TRINITY_DN893_c0_g2~~TRINITY_DN893_c0_g2_i1.p1  ORF type:complete len:901 (+),score=217.36 TRINITY_DN893_c0_g2_i1:265-2967(+)